MIFFLVPLIILASIFFVRKAVINEAKSTKQNEQCLSLKPFTYIVGYSCFAGSYALSIFLGYYSGIEAAIICLALASLSLILVFAYYGYTVKFDNEKITYRKFYGRYKKIYYKKIIDIECGIDLTIRTKDDTIIFPNYLNGVEELVIRIIQNADLKSEKNDEAVVPRVRKLKDSIYKHHEIVFVHVLMNVISVTMFVFILYSYFNDNAEGPLWTVVALLLLLASYPIVITPLTFISIKRHHSSKVWRKIAKLCVQESYFKP